MEQSIIPLLIFVLASDILLTYYVEIEVLHSIYTCPNFILELIAILLASILKQSIIIHVDDACYDHDSTTKICHVAYHQSQHVWD